jgi:uncharacterized protein YfaS (alpha-2-macroglobulin family)
MSLVAMAISAYSSIQAGRAAAGSAEQQAEQMEIDRQMQAVQAQQQSLARVEQYEADMSMNDAIFAMAGRDVSDRSIKAFQRAEAKTVQKDITRGFAQSEMEQGRTLMQAAAERARGKAAMKAGLLQAVSTTIEGISDAVKTAS